MNASQHDPTVDLTGCDSLSSVARRYATDPATANGPATVLHVADPQGRDRNAPGKPAPGDIAGHDLIHGHAADKYLADRNTSDSHELETRARRHLARRIHVAIVTPVHWSAFMGGSQYQVRCLVNALLADGRFDVSYVARRIDDTHVADGYRIVPVSRRRDVPRLGYVTDAWPLWRTLSTLRPDVIYQRIGCGYTGIAAAWARRHRVRMIWHVASDADVAAEELRTRQNALRRVAERAAVRHGIRHADTIVVQTRRQAELLERHHDRSATLVVPNFHPPPTEVPDKSDPFTVAWVANFKPLKRPEVFMRLAARCAHLEGVRFLMIGAPAARDSERRWREELARLQAEVPNLECTGAIGQDEVNAHLARAHLLVNTSDYEGFPNTFIQAWMREVPIVSLNVDPDGVLGRAQVGIHAGTEDGLVAAVELFHRDRSLLACYAENAREHALETHGLANIRELVALFEPLSDG